MAGKIYTLEDAERSCHGKGLYNFGHLIKKPIHWTGLTVVPAESTFVLREEWKSELEESWKKTLEKNPDAYDAPKTRFEGIRYDEVHGVWLVHASSDITYSQHNVLRKKEGLELAEYPVPLTINALQRTADGYLLFGQRGGTSDQSDGAVIGAGFHDFRVSKGVTYLGNLFDTTVKEVFEETEFIKDGRPVEYPVDRGKMRGMDFVRGSNTDVAFAVYVPLNVPADQCALNRTNREYTEMFRISDTGSNRNITSS